MTPSYPRSPIFFKILPIFLSILLIFFSIFLIFSPQKNFSFTENRSLAQWQKPTLRTLSDASFFLQIGKVCADQFPFRASFCSIKARAERALGKQENNGVLFGTDGYLIFKNDYKNLSIAQENLHTLQAFQEKSSLPLTTLLVPRCVDVMTDALPAHFSPENEIYTTIYDTAVTDLIPLEQLCDATKEKQVYYRTDHHWTTHGAYEAYLSLAPLLGVTPYEEGFFEQITVSSNFYGTSDAAVGGIAEQSDSIVLYRYINDQAFRCTNLQTGQSREGFYDFSALSQRDQYRIFLGGNTALLSVEATNRTEDRPRLLLVKDSFANSLVPFLALHFDLTLLDPRYDAPPLSSLLTEQSFDRVLIIQGIDTLATDRSLASKLKISSTQ